VLATSFKYTHRTKQTSKLGKVAGGRTQEKYEDERKLNAANGEPDEPRGSVSGASRALLKENTSYYLSCYTTPTEGRGRENHAMQNPTALVAVRTSAAHSRRMATRKRNAEKRKFLHERLRITRISTRWIITRAG